MSASNRLRAGLQPVASSSSAYRAFLWRSVEDSNPRRMALEASILAAKRTPRISKTLADWLGARYDT